MSSKVSIIKNVFNFGNYIIFGKGDQFTLVDFNPRLKRIRRKITITIPKTNAARNNLWFFRRPMDGINSCFYDKETDTLIIVTYRHSLVIFRDCFNEEKRFSYSEKLKSLEYVHKISKLKEGVYALLGKGSVLYCKLKIGEGIELENVKIKGIEFDSKGSEFSFTTANVLTIDEEKQLRSVVTENDLLIFNEKSGMVTQQTLYNIVTSYDIHDIPGFKNYLIAPSVDYKMMCIMRMDPSTMFLELVSRFNIGSIAPNPEDSSLKIKRILSVSPVLDKHKPDGYSNKQLIKVVLELTSYMRILFFMETDPCFRLIKKGVTITNKLCFYNRARGIKYLPSLDRTFSIAFNRNLFQDFAHPPTSIELCKSRPISDHDRAHDEEEEPLRVNFVGEEMTDCYIKISRLLGRNFSENVLRPMRYNLHNHKFYYQVDCEEEKFAKKREA